ncbi:Aldehyde ferredoxin oxidoreductase [Desulfatibacillum aliphaticivorans]|uniref:Aldehyde ferredoxin oxidoreductase n=1 Tax=Desulfatibacillum aliphaticivorans TaxID=218208 RepID=B8F8T3_DESAL|nr:aldehyde ferredoxin oxidoreductase C-terminal domain-containing protein [Desulfatibacillum aliphaticivorans]ACL01965.1 Aldehyde ferredoxin oxidoreductase [Desulfatibacillum aliphaticivorans]
MKFIRINMTDKTIKTHNVPIQYLGLGGRGLTSLLINEEVPGFCDPLGPDNKLVFAPGLLSGTPLVNTSRLSVGAKSPLTGGIKESNVGGTMAKAIAGLGITAIIVEGQAPEGALSIIRISKDGSISLDDGCQHKGMRTYALTERLQTQYGKNISVACIGPAGEYGCTSASIQATDTDDHPCRAAGRGGLGAVMGAKGIKALVVDKGGKMADEMVDLQSFKAAAKIFAQAIKDHPFSGQLLPALGTAYLLSAVNAMGAFPCYNATKGQLEGFEKISGEILAETIQARGGKTAHVGCTGCVAQCSNVFVDTDGKYVTSSLEYETLWSMGGMPGITDLDIIARLDFLCDDIGLDTMNTGVAIGVAMDAGYKDFGDGQAALEMLEEIARGTEIGMVLGHGPAAVGEYFKHSRVPVVKKQSIAAYDPRGMQGNGVTYSTSTMGADHTAGNLIGAYLGGELDPLSPEGQAEASRNLQISMASLDNTGLCMLVGGALENPDAVKALGDMITAKFGIEPGPEDGVEMGKRILNAEREFNAKAGLTKHDDRLPDFFKKEPLPPHNKTFLLSDDELDAVYNF